MRNTTRQYFDFPFNELDFTQSGDIQLSVLLYRQYSATVCTLLYIVYVLYFIVCTVLYSALYCTVQMYWNSFLQTALPSGPILRLLQVHNKSSVCCVSLVWYRHVSLCYQPQSLTCLTLLPVSVSDMSLFVTSLSPWQVSLCYQPQSLTCLTLLPTSSLTCLSLLPASVPDMSHFATSLSLWHVSLCYQPQSLASLSLLPASVPDMSYFVTSLSSWQVSLCYQPQSLTCLSLLPASVPDKSHFVTSLSPWHVSLC